MTVENVDIEKAIENVKSLLKAEKNITPALQASIELLILVITILVQRLGLNSSNSSIPPSQDPNRPRKTKKKVKGKRKPGGQKGHVGSTLLQTKTPDEIEELNIDRRSLPAGKYKNAGYESRQVFDIVMSVHVKEFRAEVLEDENGNRYVANFPDRVTKSVQYGTEVRAQSVYMSQFQLIPLARVKDYFNDQVGLPVSKGSISNFNKEAFESLEVFQKWAEKKLMASPLCHADETGINVNGKRLWLHNLSNSQITLFHPDEKRGKEAMDRMGILPNFKGILCHDHWKPYYRYDCTHSLCNAHHIRELECAWEQDEQKWAHSLKKLLETINEEVKQSGGVLPEEKHNKFLKQYRKILAKGEKECPGAPPKEKGKRGRQKKSKSRNLLERLQKFEMDTLRFMSNEIVPFTNNQGENDLRMTKVQQKISGCFRSMDGARIFCRVRSYLTTARKHGVSPTDALRLLFEGKLPDFVI
jgi:transposase